MSAMNIDLRIRGVAQVGQAATAVNDLAKAIRGLSGAVGSNSGQLSLNLGGRGVSGRVGGGSAGGRSLGAYGNLGIAQQLLGGAMASGNPQMVADAQARFLRAQQAVQRQQNLLNPQGTPFGQRLQNWAYSTRVGQGASPLVGRSLDLIGMGKFAGPVGVAAVAVGGFAKAVDFARERLVSFGGLSGIGGGSPADTARARQAAGTVGMDPQAYSQAARRAQQDYFSSPEKSRYLRMYGYRNPGFGPNRRTDAVGDYNAFMRRLLTDPNRERALRALQELGMEQFAPMIGDRKLIDTAFSGGQGINNADTKRGMHWNAAIENLKNRAADSFAVGGVPGLFKELGTWGMVPEMIRGKQSGGRESVVDEQTRTLKDIRDGVNALVDNTRMFRGGGASLRGSVPNAWQWFDAQDQAVIKQAAALGAFGV